MKLNNLVFDFDKFAFEMANLKEKKHFDYLVTSLAKTSVARRDSDVSIFSRIPRLTSAPA